MSDPHFEDAAGGPDVAAERGRPPWRRARWWLLGGALLAAAVAGEGSLDEGAQASTDRVFRRALVTYAAARSLDAAVSLAEGTELALEPGGVGVTVSAGEILEPIDDLVEQFSTLMLISATSLGIQGLLLRASAWAPLTLLLIGLLAARVAVAFVPTRIPPGVTRFVRVGSVVLLLLRFAVPVYALGSSMIFERYLQAGQEEAVAGIENTRDDVREIDQLDEAEAPTGIVGRVSDWFAGAMERLDVSERIEAMRDRVDAAVSDLMHLLVVFSLQTIVLPVAFLWGLTRVLARLTGSR